MTKKARITNQQLGKKDIQKKYKMTKEKREARRKFSKIRKGKNFLFQKCKKVKETSFTFLIFYKFLMPS